jgi:hypothetical protein
MCAMGVRRRCSLRALLATTIVLAAGASASAFAAAGGWTTESVPSPAGVIDLNTVSCGAAGECMTIGAGTPFGSIGLRLHAGRWTPVALARPERRWLIEAVSCASRGSCVAVGEFETAAKGHPEFTLAERWNGRRWAVMAMPRVRGELDGVSCIAANDCVAVGQRTSASASLIERWNGADWSLSPPAEPAGGRPLAAVSCTSAQACMAVGQLGVEARETPFAERLDGSGWHVEKVPVPTSIATKTSSVASFEAVSCAGPSFCAASGNYVTTGPYPQPLAGVWNASGWHVEAIPHHHPELNLVGVACLSPSSCQAVGFTLHSTLAIGWNGANWSLELTPPSHSNRQFPTEFSAASTIPGGGYLAVGYVQAHRTLKALVERHP